MRISILAVLMTLLPVSLPAADVVLDPELHASLDALTADTSVPVPPAQTPPNVLPPVDPGVMKANYQTPAAESRNEDYYTLDQLRGEMKKLAWKKGDFTVTPFGRIIVDTVFETERSTEGDLILWVDSPDVQGEPASYVDAKSTRLGLDIGGPTVPCCGDAVLAGKVEFDFQGQYVYRNKSGVLFRQAYVELRNEEGRFLAGQAWEVISPLYPGNLNYVPGSAAGNLGYRRAQVLGERYLTFSDTSLVTLQTSLNMGVQIDYAKDPTVVEGPSGWPVVEGRAAWKLGERKGPDALPVEFGVSGHIGEDIYDFLPPNPNPRDDVARKTWSFNVDANMPITKRFGARAEYFVGENLAAYMGGILQGVDPVTRKGIRSTGGWFDVRYDWTRRWHSYAGWSVDDPFNQDVSVGRTYNQFYFANLLFDVTKELMLGLDVSVWKTNWVDKEPGNSVRFDFQVRYNF